MDVTEIPSLFRIFSFKVFALLDVFSRMLLAARLTIGEPTARDAAELLAKAACTHGRPRHFVSDRRGQFTGEEFRKALAERAVRHRFGAVGKTGSIAVIERFWRTVKESLGLPLFRPLILRDLERRIELTLLHYAYLRPHQGLARATPAGVYFGLTPRCLSASSPPRARGEGSLDPPFGTAHLDPERRLPFLYPKAA